MVLSCCRLRFERCAKSGAELLDWLGASALTWTGAVDIARAIALTRSGMKHEFHNVCGEIKVLATQQA